MATVVRDRARAVVQGGEVEFRAWVDYEAPPRIRYVVQGELLEFRVWLDPDGPLRMADRVVVTDEITLQVTKTLTLADAVVVTDAVSSSRVIERAFADAVAMSDAFGRTATFSLGLADAVVMADNTLATMGNVTQLAPADTVAVVDAGVLQHYDYASTDYFLTPVDYVSAQRTF